MLSWRFERDGGYSQYVTQSSLAKTERVLVLHLIEALADQLELIPLLMPGFVALEGLAILELHLGPEALDAVELWMVGGVEDELDVVLFAEFLDFLTMVDSEIVQEDVPSLIGTLEPGPHHELELAEELDEGLLGGGPGRLGQQDLT